MKKNRKLETNPRKTESTPSFLELLGHRSRHIMVYLLTFTIDINTLGIGKYTMRDCQSTQKLVFFTPFPRMRCPWMGGEVVNQQLVIPITHWVTVSSTEKNPHETWTLDFLYHGKLPLVFPPSTWEAYIVSNRSKFLGKYLGKLAPRCYPRIREAAVKEAEAKVAASQGDQKRGAGPWPKTRVFDWIKIGEKIGSR